MKKPLICCLFTLVIINIKTIAQTISNESLKKWLGTYSSTLPCTDCKEMQYVISLKPDRSFREEIIYVGKSDKIETNLGRFVVSGNGILSLTRSNQGPKFFRKHPDGLRMLDENAKIRTENSAYLLKEAKLITSPELLNQKYMNNISCYLFADSLDWSLDIVSQKTVTFKSKQDSTVLFLSKPDTSKVQTIHYIAKNDSIEMDILIQKDSVRNSVSGERFANRVVLNVKKPNKANVLLKGAGRFLPDYRINNIWVLKTMNGKKLKPKQFAKGFPTLEINTRDNRIHGFSGCDNYTGEAIFEANAFVANLNRISGTNCEAKKMEVKFFNALNSKLLTYRFSDYTDFLQILEKGKVVLELKNVD
jgi:heat shock protein HslJ